MKKTTIHILMVVLLAMTTTFMGCGDGRHMSRSLWGVSPAPSEGLGVAMLECVDVRGYKNWDYDNLAIDNDEDEELIESEITNDSNINSTEKDLSLKYADYSVIKTTDILSKIYIDNKAGASDIDIKSDNSGEDAKKCIKSEIKELKKCGASCEQYWGGKTWLLTRSKLNKKPRTEEVEIVNFESCKQIQEIDCLYID